jgi:hypothetical protein
LNTDDKSSITMLVFKFKIIYSILIILCLISIIYIIVNDNILLHLFSDKTILFMAESILSGISLLVLIVFCLWPIIFKYSRNNIKYILTGQLFRVFLVTTIGSYGITLNLLGSTGLIKIAMPIVSLVALITEYPTTQRINKWNKNTYMTD